MNLSSEQFLLAVASGACVAGAALINFVISISVKVGKLETRVDTAEQDLDGLGTLIRNQKNSNRRAS